MSAAPRPTLRAAVAALPAALYRRSTWKGLLYFARDLLLYAAAVVLLIRTDHPLALLLLWPLAGLSISALFVLGHDAAHGALFDSPRLCAAVGRLALLPSLHGFSVWVLGHNRIHHVHTNRAGVDFVWHPLTPSEYAVLSPLGKLRHRFEWSAWGAGLYYLRVVWWERMMRLAPPVRFQRAFRRDRTLVWTYAAAVSLGFLAIGYSGHGSPARAAWMWGKTFLVPWLAWNYFIGATVYVHHIGPNVPWYAPQGWTRFKGQVEATTHLVAPRWYNLFAQNIYLHVPHHVDPRIPFYNLPAAAAALGRRFPGMFQTRPLRLRDYLRATRRCKLYDFDRAGWCDYRGRAALEPARDEHQRASQTEARSASALASS
jgi:omega-6 fatty acid desaturase (delta-12 desaturase)